MAGVRRPSQPTSDPGAVQAELDELFWYHTIDVVPGVVTRGWWDLRHALPLLPFPDVTGLRCLDIGTWDGFYAYELERRGAAEVVALDVPDLSAIDWPPEVLADPAFVPVRPDEQPRSAGFHRLHDLLDSKVRWHGGSIYDLDPAELGTFDLVVVGSLLVHLRDPVRALDAVRRVVAPGGRFLLAEFVHLPLNAPLRRSRPLFELRGETQDFQWWLGNDQGLRQLLHVGGFDVEATSPYFLLRPGEHYATRKLRRITARDHARRAANWRWTRDATHGGHLHRGYLSRPRF